MHTNPSRSIISPAAMNRVKARQNRDNLRKRQRGIITLRFIDALCVSIGLIGFFVVWAAILGLLP